MDGDPVDGGATWLTVSAGRGCRLRVRAHLRAAAVVDPAEARDLLDGLPVPWWVAGGWAIEAFTGVAREHEDIDLSIFRRDLPAVRRHLEGGLAPVGGVRAGPDPPGARTARCLTYAEQVWVREHALAPWRGEFVLNADVDGRWQFKRDPSVVGDRGGDVGARRDPLPATRAGARAQGGRGQGQGRRGSDRCPPPARVERARVAGGLRGATRTGAPLARAAQTSTTIMTVRRGARCRRRRPGSSGCARRPSGTRRGRRRMH